jgi:hypothetical protein
MLTRRGSISSSEHFGRQICAPQQCPRSTRSHTHHDLRRTLSADHWVWFSEQFKRHLSEDVLPLLLDRLSSEGEAGGAGEA